MRNGGLGQVLAGLDRSQRIVEQDIVELLHLHRIPHRQGRSAIALLFSGGNHGRIHLPELALLTGSRFFQVLRGCLDDVHCSQMGMGMNGLGRCDRAEQFGDLREAVLLRAFGICQVSAVGLALTRKGLILTTRISLRLGSLPGRQSS